MTKEFNNINLSRNCFSSDYVFTTRYTVNYIFKHCIKCWDQSFLLPCDDSNSEFTKFCIENKLIFKNVDENADFFKFYNHMVELNIKYDCIVTNPPFSNHYIFLDKFVDLLNRGLVDDVYLLLPLSTLETSNRCSLYKHHLYEVFIFSNRLKFKGWSNSFNKACCVVHLRKEQNWPIIRFLFN